MRSGPSDQREPLTRLWQAGRDDSAGDNETCSRPPTDLRGSPAAHASHKRVPNGSMIRWEEPEQRNERIFAARRK